MRISRTAPSRRCPKCSANLDAHAHPDASPIKGDLSVCAYCFAYLQFDSELELVLIEGLPGGLSRLARMELRALESARRQCEQLAALRGGSHG